MDILQKLVLEMLSLEDSISEKRNETKALRKQVQAIKEKIKLQSKETI